MSSLVIENAPLLACAFQALATKSQVLKSSFTKSAARVSQYASTFFLSAEFLKHIGRVSLVNTLTILAFSAVSITLEAFGNENLNASLDSICNISNMAISVTLIVMGTSVFSFVGGVLTLNLIKLIVNANTKPENEDPETNTDDDVEPVEGEESEDDDVESVEEDSDSDSESESVDNEEELARIQREGAENLARLERENKKENARIQREDQEERAKIQREAAENLARMQREGAEDLARIQHEAAKNNARRQHEAAKNNARRQREAVENLARMQHEAAEQERRELQAAQRKIRAEVVKRKKILLTKKKELIEKYKKSKAEQNSKFEIEKANIRKQSEDPVQALLLTIRMKSCKEIHKAGLDTLKSRLCFDFVMFKFQQNPNFIIGTEQRRLLKLMNNPKRKPNDFSFLA